MCLNNLYIFFESVVYAFGTINTINSEYAQYLIIKFKKRVLIIIFKYLKPKSKLLFHHNFINVELSEEFYN